MRSLKLRFPDEADPEQFPDAPGIVIPPALDFASKPSKEKIRACIEANLALGVDLTNIGNESPENAKYITSLGDHSTRVKINGKDIPLNIHMDQVDVAGTRYPGLVGIRHWCRVPIKADYFLDVMSRLSYTNALDKFMFYIEQVEDIRDCMDDTEGWCHVAYTADQILAKHVFSVREFVTMDFLSGKHQLAISRSCSHPKHAVTETPTWNFWKSRDRRYRVPLLHLNRVLPDPDGDPNYCISVQFQYSDVGGNVTVEEQVTAVKEFGTDNIPNMFRIAKTALDKELDLGKESSEYLKDPLHPKWRKKVSEMIPGM